MTPVAPLCATRARLRAFTAHTVVSRPACAQYSDGDEAFRKDRAVWYEHVTGESLDGLPLIEQWARVDVIARRFRAYSDGRATRAVP